MTGAGNVVYNQTRKSKYKNVGLYARHFCMRRNGQQEKNNRAAAIAAVTAIAAIAAIATVAAIMAITAIAAIAAFAAFADIAGIGDCCGLFYLYIHRPRPGHW